MRTPEFLRGKLLSTCERIKTTEPSPVKNFHYHNNGYNQCLPKPLGRDNHQIITNYGDSNNQKANPKYISQSNTRRRQNYLEKLSNYQTR